MNNLVNPEAETRNGYHITAQMKQVWNIQLDMFQKLIDVCQKHGLRCWCCDGTMLGAVRHHGYIPWDDDIDVCMPRPDYDRLQAIAQEEFKDPYFLQTALTDKHYYRGHAQLRRSDTAAIRPSDCYRPFNQGIFIDIFILEGVSQDRNEMERIVKTANKRMKCLKSIDYPILVSGRFGLLFRKYKWRWMVHKYGFYNLFKIVEDLYRKNSWDDCAHVAKLGYGGMRFIFLRSIFDETLWVNLEQLKVPIPIGYDLFLRTEFGDDYMTPLQENNYHGQLVIDTTHSYREIMPKVKKAYRWRWFSKFNRLSHSK